LSESGVRIALLINQEQSANIRHCGNFLHSHQRSKLVKNEHVPARHGRVDAHAQALPTTPLLTTPPAAPARPVLPHVAHELRLQLLCAPFSANMQCSLAHRQFLVPGRQMDHRKFVIFKRGPHHPPAVTDSLEHTTIGAGASEKRIRSKQNLGHDQSLGLQNCSRGVFAGHHPIGPPATAGHQAAAHPRRETISALRPPGI
jgi:hypothetical protein